MKFKNVIAITGMILSNVGFSNDFIISRHNTLLDLHKQGVAPSISSDITGLRTGKCFTYDLYEHNGEVMDYKASDAILFGYTEPNAGPFDRVTKIHVSNYTEGTITPESISGMEVDEFRKFELEIISELSATGATPLLLNSGAYTAEYKYIPERIAYQSVKKNGDFIIVKIDHYFKYLDEARGYWQNADQVCYFDNYNQYPL